MPELFPSLASQSNITRYALQPAYVHWWASTYIVSMYALEMTYLDELLSSILDCPVVVDTAVIFVFVPLCPESSLSDCSLVTLVV